jgi:hypothetical protein
MKKWIVTLPVKGLSFEVEEENEQRVFDYIINNRGDFSNITVEDLVGGTIDRKNEND